MTVPGWLDTPMQIDSDGGWASLRLHRAYEMPMTVPTKPATAEPTKRDTPSEAATPLVDYSSEVSWWGAFSSP